MIKEILFVFILKFLFQTKFIVEIKNSDDTWPMRLELKFCIYQSPHTKIWTFDVYDTVGKLCIIQCNCVKGILQRRTVI